MRVATTRGTSDTKCNSIIIICNIDAIKKNEYILFILTYIINFKTQCPAFAQPSTKKSQRQFLLYKIVCRMPQDRTSNLSPCVEQNIREAQLFYYITYINVMYEMRSHNADESDVGHSLSVGRLCAPSPVHYDHSRALVALQVQQRHGHALQLHKT